MVPVLERVLGWGTGEIRSLFESNGLSLHEWEKARTDRIISARDRQPTRSERGRMMTIEYLGWAATAVFVASYFCTRSHVLKAVQMIGALMWVAYGLLHRRLAGGRRQSRGLRCGGLDPHASEASLAAVAPLETDASPLAYCIGCVVDDRRVKEAVWEDQVGTAH